MSSRDPEPEWPPHGQQNEGTGEYSVLNELHRILESVKAWTKWLQIQWPTMRPVRSPNALASIRLILSREDTQPMRETPSELQTT